MDAGHSCFPLMTKMVTHKSLKCPWITKGIIQSSKTKFDLYKRAKEGSIPAEQYNIYRNKLTSLIRKSKKQYIYNFFSNYKNDLKKVWSKINTLTCKKGKSHKLNSIKVNGRSSNNPKVIANEFNHFFANVGKKLYDALPDS